MKPSDLHEHLVAAVGHLQAALVAAGVDLSDTEVPEAVDAAVLADPGYAAARLQLRQAMEGLVDSDQSAAGRQALFAVEEAAHAAIAAAVDAGWRLGACGRPGATSTL